MRAASGRSEDETISALEELVRRGLVREVGGGERGTAFDFGHARLRDAAYEATSLARRRLLHRRVAEVLRAAPDGRDDPGRLALIAGHERAAGRDAEAAEAFREAGARARAVYANREALDHLGTALALGHPDVAGLETMIGELRTALGDYAGAVAALEAAAAVTPDAGLPAIELRLGRVHARRGDTTTAASHLDGAIDQLDGRPGDGRPAPARGDPRRAERGRGPFGRPRARRRARRAGPRRRHGRRRPARDRRGAPTAGPRGEGARRPRRGAGRVDAEPRDGRRRPRPGRGDRRAERAGARRAAAGDRDAAIRLLEAALVACRRTGELHLEAAVENNLADQLHAAGRPDEAMVHLKRAVALFADVGGRPGRARAGDLEAGGLVSVSRTTENEPPSVNVRSG